MGQARSNADGLAETDGAATTNGDHAVCFHGSGIFQRLLGDIGRCMHSCLGEDASNVDAALKVGFKQLGLVDLLGRGEQQRGFEIQTLDLVSELGEGSMAKDDPGRSGIVLERVHC